VFTLPRSVAGISVLIFVACVHCLLVCPLSDRRARWLQLGGDSFGNREVEKLADFIKQSSYMSKVKRCLRIKVKKVEAQGESTSGGA
jgi:hypothetical protein